MNVIIFGATGFFGHAFISRIKNHNVTCITREEVVSDLPLKFIRYQDFEKEKFQKLF